MSQTKERTEQPAPPLAGEAPSAGTLQPASAEANAPARPAQATLIRPEPVPADPAALAGGGSGLAISGFLGLCLLPTVLTLAYFLLVAAPQFASEARFVVRGQVEHLGIQGVGLAAQLTALNNVQEAHVIGEYIRSPAMVDELRKEHDLEAIYARPRLDLLFRLRPGSSLDDLVRYWNRMVHVRVEASSGVVSVTVYAFRPEDAEALMQSVLKASERITNAFTERMRRDRMERAEHDVAQAKADMDGLLAALEASRNRQDTLDALTTATSIETLISTLRDERATIAAERASAASRLRGDAPSLRLFDERLRSLDEQIAKLVAALDARERGVGSLVDAISMFDLIAARRDVIAQRLSRVESNLTQARLAALRQQVYVVPFMTPTRGELSVRPSPWTTALIVFLATGTLYGILFLFGADLRDRTR